MYDVIGFALVRRPILKLAWTCTKPSLANAIARPPKKNALLPYCMWVAGSHELLRILDAKQAKHCTRGFLKIFCMMHLACNEVAGSNELLQMLDAKQAKHYTRRFLKSICMMHLACNDPFESLSLEA